jgi:hypothetical protein
VVVVEDAAREGVVMTLILCELEGERAISGPFAVLLAASVCRFPFLAPVTVQHVDAVTIGVKPFRSLRNHLHVLGTEDLLNFVSNHEHICKRLSLEDSHINIDHFLVFRVAITVDDRLRSEHLR